MRKAAWWILAVLVAVPVRADDGAASISAGGIVLMKREPRIVMAKEVLEISTDRVIVDYDFRNDSDQDITTEVAFPIPPYILDSEGWATLSQMGFDDFRLWVADKPVRFTIETRAFVGKHDVTSALLAMRVDPGSMGHYKEDNSTANFKVPDIERLSASQRQRLTAIGAIGDRNGIEPHWRVEKKYHWTQTFPARATLHIRHEYTPVGGSRNVVGVDAQTGKPDPELAQLCPPASILSRLKNSESDANPAGLFYVDFILTTANTWKTPIEDFTLIVDRPANPGYKVNLVSFCWSGPVTRPDENHFSAHLTNFIPARELEIGFIRSHFTKDE